jgi:anti-sigma B factor antagonist
MELEYIELENGIRLIKLKGRLDLNGTYNVEVSFVRHCAGENIRVLVDLSEVDFLSSVGIPMLVNTAKSVMNRGGKFALLRPSENVVGVLELVGVSHVIPIYEDLNSALAGMQ